MRAAERVLGAARIDAEVASRPGDSLYEGDKQHAQKLRDAVNSPPPVYMQEVGAGGERTASSAMRSRLKKVTEPVRTITAPKRL
jgi:hypothetical protein